MHGTATTSPVKAHLIIYGIKDCSDNISPEVYDHQLTEAMYEYDNGDMKMNTDLNLDNHLIKNLKDGVTDSDGVNKRQIDAVSNYSNGHIYRTMFGNNYYDLVETSRFSLAQTANGVVINGVSPNFVLETNRLITDYNPRYVLRLSTKSHIRTTNIFKNTSFTFFMSFMHDTNKTCQITFSNTLQFHIKFYPRYLITSNKLIIDHQSGTYETSITHK